LISKISKGIVWQEKNAVAEMTGAKVTTAGKTKMQIIGGRSGVPARKEDRGGIDGRVHDFLSPPLFKGSTTS